jgi:plasmid replication initiation protein
MVDLLLPDRHPMRDFFALDVLDVTPKSDMATMEHPVFSLSTKPETRTLSYAHSDVKIEIIPSSIGLPTVFDKDILIYCISKLVHMKNAGQPIGASVRLTTHDMLRQTNRPTNNLGYERLLPALNRLRGVVINTTIATGDQMTTKGFGLIDEFEYNRKGSMFADRLRFLEIKLSPWLFRAIDSFEVLPISPAYFRLRRPLDRRLYELGRKHCGSVQREWKIGMDKLQKKTGSASPPKWFAFYLRDVEKTDHLPDYRLRIEEDFVVYTRRGNFAGHDPDEITHDGLDALLDIDVLEQARGMAKARNRDFDVLKSEFIGFMKASGKPRNLNGAFLGFINKKQRL